MDVMSDDLKDPGSPVEGDPIEWYDREYADDVTPIADVTVTDEVPVVLDGDPTPRGGITVVPPRGASDRAAPGRVVAAAVDERASRPGARHVDPCWSPRRSS